MKTKRFDTKVLAQAALCAALCYVGATFIKIDIPVGTEIRSVCLRLFLSEAYGAAYRELLV